VHRVDKEKTVYRVFLVHKDYRGLRGNLEYKETKEYKVFKETYLMNVFGTEMALVFIHSTT